MACCAVMLPPTMLQQPLASKVFRGDSEDMVDRLIVACQEARAPAAGYTGFGRALEPASAWLCEETAPVASTTTRNLASSPNAKKNSNNSISNAKKFPQGSHKHARSSPSKTSSMPSSPEHKRGGTVCAQTMRAIKTATTGALVAPTKAAAPAVTSNAFACPAIAASPKPEAVPMPTSSLLTRALRGRSPSPDKTVNCGARLLQQLQAVRA